jgi:hypothetical protein
MAIQGQTAFDLGVGNGVGSIGTGTQKGISAGPVNTQLKSGPGWVGTFVNADTAARGMAVYDSATTATTASQQIYYNPSVPAGAVIQLNVPAVSGIVFYSSAVATNNAWLVFA